MQIATIAPRQSKGFAKAPSPVSCRRAAASRRSIGATRSSRRSSCRGSSRMQLTQDPAEGYFFVRACRPHAITIVDRELPRSFVLAPDRVVEDWPVTNASEFDTAAADAIAALNPEVVLL